MSTEFRGHHNAVADGSQTGTSSTHGCKSPPTHASAPAWPDPLEFDGAGILFRIWARPVLSAGGTEVVPVTLIWQHADGTHGRRRCGGVIEATQYAARVVSEAGCGTRLTA